MLAEYQQVFRGERQDERQAETAQARRGTEDDDDRAINDEESRHVCRQGALVLTLREQRLQTRPVPEVVRPIDHGEHRNPQHPRRVDDRPLDSAQLARHKRLGRRVDVPPARPLVMPAVNALPVAEGYEREESGELAQRRVEALGAKERLVTALVEQREPLNEREGEQKLAGSPSPPPRREGERDAARGDGDTGERDSSAGCVRGTKLRQRRR